MRKLNNMCLFLLGSLLFLTTNVSYATDLAKDIKAGAYAGYNVLFVSFDALQAGHTSCLGYFRKTTPTIDYFASNGYLFKNAMAQSAKFPNSYH